MDNQPHFNRRETEGQSEAEHPVHGHANGRWHRTRTLICAGWSLEAVLLITRLSGLPWVSSSLGQQLAGTHSTWTIHPAMWTASLKSKDAILYPVSCSPCVHPQVGQVTNRQDQPAVPQQGSARVHSPLGGLLKAGWLHPPLCLGHLPQIKTQTQASKAGNASTLEAR